MADSNAAEQVILASLRRVRRQLFLVRLGERVALAAAWGAAVAACLVAGRLVHERFAWLGILLCILPVAEGVWLWKQAKQVSPMWLAMGGAVLTVLVTALGATALFWNVTAGEPAWMYAAGTMVVFVLAAAVTVRPVDVRTAAIFVDRRVGLEERVSTALELLKTPAASPLEAAFRGPVFNAAMEACVRARHEKIGYARMDSRVYPLAAAVTAAAIACAIMVMPLPAAASMSRKPFLVVAEKGKKLDAILKELEKEKPPQSDSAQQKLQPLHEAVTQLKKGNMSPFEADARLNEEKAELQKEQDKLDAAEKVEKAIESIKGMEEVAKATEQEKNVGLKNPQESGAGGEKDKADKSVKDAAGTLADKVKGAMSPEDKKKLADDLDKAGEQAKGDPQLQKDLHSAAEDVRKGDSDKLAQDLSSAAQRSGEQGAQSQLTGESLKDAMSAIDRAENNGMGSDEKDAQNNGGDSGQQQADSGQNGQQQSPQRQNGGGQQGAGQQGPQQANGQQGGNQQGGQGNRPGAGQQASAGGGREAGGENGEGGSTNLHEPGGPGHHEGGPVNGAHDFVKIYDQTVINSEGKTEKVSGKINPLAPAAGTADVFGQADKGDSSIQTYESQLPAARKRAMDDLQTQQIPPQYRDFVRTYYEK